MRMTSHATMIYIPDNELFEKYINENDEGYKITKDRSHCYLLSYSYVVALIVSFFRCGPIADVKRTSADFCVAIRQILDLKFCKLYVDVHFSNCNSTTLHINHWFRFGRTRTPES